HAYVLLVSLGDVGARALGIGYWQWGVWCGSWRNSPDVFPDRARQLDRGQPGPVDPSARRSAVPHIPEQSHRIRKIGNIPPGGHLKRVVRAVDEDRPIRDAPLLEEIDELVQL